MDELKQNQETEQGAGKTDDPATADYKKGRELCEAGDTVQAASLFHNALLGFEQNGDDRGVANASDQLGDLCAGRQEHEKALAHYERAFGICDREKDMFSLVALQKKMVLCKKALKQYDDAVKIYLHVIDIYGGYNNPAGTVAAMEDLAQLYLEMGQRQKSADTYRTIASIHRNFSHSLQAREFMKKAEQVEQGSA